MVGLYKDPNGETIFEMTPPRSVPKMPPSPDNTKVMMTTAGDDDATLIQKERELEHELQVVRVSIVYSM